MYPILKRLYIVSYIIAAALSLPCAFIAFAGSNGSNDMVFIFSVCVLCYALLPWIIGLIYWIIKGPDIMR